jgi:hypothetical protein
MIFAPLKAKVISPNEVERSAAAMASEVANNRPPGTLVEPYTPECVYILTTISPVGLPFFFRLN